MTETSVPRYPSLAGRAALVTGGASGIGAAIVTALAEQGCKVAFIDRDAAAGADLARTLASSPHPVVFRAVDLIDVEATRRVVQALEDELGGGGFRIVVHNAGWDERHELDGLGVDQWDEIQAVNLRPHFFVTQVVAPGMRRAGGGSMIHLGSTSVRLKVSGMPGYLAAKAGIVGLTRAFARELGPDRIRVNAVLPGWVMTERQRQRWVTPADEETLLREQCLARLLIPEDVARLVLFLASEQSAMITGQVHVIDGGQT